MPSITFHPVVFANHLREDGTINVKIRLTFKRRDRKIPTTINVRRQDLTRSGKIKTQAIIDRLDAEVRRLRSLCDDLNAFALEDMDVDDVLAHIRRRSRDERFSLDFCQFWADQAKRNKVNTARTSISALRSFQRFMGRDEVDISEITSSMMRIYEEWLIDQHGREARSVSQYLSALAHIHRLARLKYNSEELDSQPIRNPFEYYTPPTQQASKVGHRDTSVETLRLMMSKRESLDGKQRLGVDLFLLSFFLMGCNIPDIYEMKPAVDGILSYNRQKTRDRRADHAPCRIRIEDCASFLINEYADTFHQRAFNYYRRYASYISLRDCANRGLKAFCDANGIPVMTLYTARHTWATQAYRLGIPSHIITDALVHKDSARAMDDIYTHKDWSLVWEANLKVISAVLA